MSFCFVFSEAGKRKHSFLVALQINRKRAVAMGGKKHFVFSLDKSGRLMRGRLAKLINTLITKVDKQYNKMYLFFLLQLFFLYYGSFAA